MISNNLYGYKTPTTYNKAELLAKQVASANKWKMEKMEGDIDPNSFAAKLKRADEYAASGESYSATDSIGIILRQMDDPTKAGERVNKDVWHNGVRVSVTKDLLHGTTITIGGSSSPDWIYVSTSVGTVKIDLNDMTGLEKCLDLFSPEDVAAIMKKIMEVKQAREALNEIDKMNDNLFRDDRAEKKDDGNGQEQSISEAVGVVGAEEMRNIEGTREKKFLG